MDKPLEHYWKLRLAELKEELEANNFEVHTADSVSDAKRIVLENLIPKINPKSVSWGGSMTFTATGLYDALKSDGRFEVLDVFDRNLTPQENIELRRRSLLVDLYITGTNAVTGDR